MLGRALRASQRVVLPLALTVIAALAFSAKASQEISGDLTAANQVYDGFTYKISTALSANSAVTLRVQIPTIIGGGLTIEGWDRAELGGQYAFSLLVSQGSIRDSSLFVKGAIPGIGVIGIDNVRVVSSVSQPTFDFTGLRTSSNLTVSVASTFAMYSGAGLDADMVSVGSGATPAYFGGPTSFVVAASDITGGSCILRLTAASPQAVVAVTGKSLVGVDSSRTFGLGTAPLCFSNGVVVADSSVVRVTDTPLPSAVVDGVRRTPRSAIDLHDPAFSVTGGSMLVVRGITMPDGGTVFGSVNGATLSSFNLGANSIFSLLDITAGSFCAACDATGLPNTRDGTAAVYAQGWTMGGTTVTNFAGQGLNAATTLTNLRDSSGQCRPALCLPVNSNGVREVSGSCACDCIADSRAPMCTPNPPAMTILPTCRVARCSTCVPGRSDRCETCEGGSPADSNGHCGGGNDSAHPPRSLGRLAGMLLVLSGSVLAWF